MQTALIDKKRQIIIITPNIYDNNLNFVNNESMKHSKGKLSSTSMTQTQTIITSRKFQASASPRIQGHQKENLANKSKKRHSFRWFRTVMEAANQAEEVLLSSNGKSKLAKKKNKKQFHPEKRVCRNILCISV